MIFWEAYYDTSTRMVARKRIIALDTNSLWDFGKDLSLAGSTVPRKSNP